MACFQDRSRGFVSELTYPQEETGKPVFVEKPLRVHFLPSELDFYRSYPWSLNAYPTVGEVIGYLREELRRLDLAEEEWHLEQIRINIFLLSCGLLNEIDDYLVGRQYNFSKLARVPLARAVIRAADAATAFTRQLHEWRFRDLASWRDDWQTAVAQYLEIFVVSEERQSRLPAHTKTRLTELLGARLPAKLLGRRLRNAAFFHGRELTHFDVLRLGERFVVASPDRHKSIVLVGLRTAGSYFGPLLQAYLKANGYSDVKLVTMRPKSPLAGREKSRLATFAREGRTFVIVDESPIGGGTTATVIKMLRKMGCTQIVTLLPIHRLHRDWKKGWNKQKIAGVTAVTLESDEWHKQRSLETRAIGVFLQDYFRARGYLTASVRDSAAAESLNQSLQQMSLEKMHTRLKRIYEVELRTSGGTLETRYVLAKSVGWGWLSYRSFLVSERLSRFVPPVLGLRNGFLFTEWRPHSNHEAGVSRGEQLENIAAYVAARVRLLSLDSDPTTDLLRSNQHTGFEELADILLGAYGSRMARFLKRPAIRKTLAQQVCSVPTFTDSKMHRLEWISEPSFQWKTDFEHHCMGKAEFEMTDPAYDLAEAILHFTLSEEEEQKLIANYIEESGDTGVSERLFFSKLLAGRRSLQQGFAYLKEGHLSHRYQEFNQQYLDAGNFLTTHTMRLCANLCRRPERVRWASPLVVLDIDGVLDRPVFGFSSTTGAGIQAISLLHAHNLPIALDTARSISEVKEYCHAYSCVGGVAEYGSVIWDAVSGQEQILVSSEALTQLDQLRHALREVPGVFLNEAYQCSIRAYTFNSEQTAALPTLLIQHFIATLNLNLLRFHQTTLDTAILAKDVDKGKGLLALVNAFGKKGSEIIAIGDSEPDLAMFRFSARAFSPSQIWCREDAEALGCHIAARPYQAGLLESVRLVVHPDGRMCHICRSCREISRNSRDLFVQLLDVADQQRIKVLVQATTDPLAIGAFAK